MTTGSFDEDGLVQAKRLIDEIEGELPRRMSSDGVVVGDPHTRKLIRVLRILTDQIESMQAER